MVACLLALVRKGEYKFQLNKEKAFYSFVNLKNLLIFHDTELGRVPIGNGGHFK